MQEQVQETSVPAEVSSVENLTPPEATPVSESTTSEVAKTPRPERKRRQRNENRNDLPVRIIPPKKVVRVLSVGMQVDGNVRRVADFGAFVDIGVGTDGLVHVSEISQRRVARASDALKEGDAVVAWIKELDRDRNRISLTMIEPGLKTIRDLNEGDLVTGKVTRVVAYAAFVDIGVGRDAMLHVKEMSDGFVRRVEDVANVGDEIEAKIVTLDRRRQRIDLSLKGLRPSTEIVVPAPEEMLEEMKPARRRGRPQASGIEDVLASGAHFQEEFDSERGRNRRDRRRKNGKEREKEDWSSYLVDEEEIGPTALGLALQAALSDDEDDDNRSRLRGGKRGRQREVYRDEQEEALQRTLQMRNG